MQTEMEARGQLNIGKVDVLGVELEYRWSGDPSQQPPIVLLHEGLGSLSMWRNFPDRLATATGSAVLTYSRAGYGGSGPAKLPRDPDYLHVEGQRVLPELLERLGLEQPILFGHSDGGSIALIYAGSYPQSVRALILEAPHVFVEPMTVAGVTQLKSVYEQTDLPRKLSRHHAQVDAAFWGWTNVRLDQRMLHWNIQSYLDPITCPILLIQGVDDEYGTDAQLDAIAARTPATRTLLLESCGHSPHRDQAEATLSAVSLFLEDLLQHDTP